SKIAATIGSPVANSMCQGHFGDITRVVGTLACPIAEGGTKAVTHGGHLHPAMVGTVGCWRPLEGLEPIASFENKHAFQKIFPFPKGWLGLRLRILARGQ